MFTLILFFDMFLEGFHCRLRVHNLQDLQVILASIFWESQDNLAED